MKPKLLDLFCGAGGCSVGYARAGFDVVGVDIKPQPNYPFAFYQKDALTFPDQLFANKLLEFDVIHASPPCQQYSDLRHRTGKEYPDIVADIRQRLIDSDIPYVIENVESAPLINSIILCGTMFPQLRVLRHRAFESSIAIKAPAHSNKHPLVYTKDKRKRHYGVLDEKTSFVQVTGGGNCSVRRAKQAMGINWDMTKEEVNEAIPPAYTEYIGIQLREQLGI